MRIFENNLIFIEIHESEIPWLKIFTNRKIKEFSQATKEEKEAILKALDVIEKEMIAFFNPTKINIAQFGNYLPHLHWHIMARFENDSYFPESMWGKKQREGTHKIKKLDEFVEKIKKILE
ncbi:MAG: hypothetical protein QG567_2519 [Campylobacterota bacterium]|nr:hypothetical protein [Campylobacterota bacterium]